MLRNILSLMLLLTAMPAMAADPHAQAGLPQLDPTWFASQVFWLVIHFAALYLIALKLILPRIAASLERRAGRIAGDIEQADKLHKEASTSRTAYEAALADARKAAHAAREQSAVQAADEQAKAEHKLAAELAARAVAANERIAKASAELQGRMSEVAGEAALEIITRLGGIADKAAVDAALSKILDSRLKEVA